jgi:hypothetical protein
LPITVHLDPSAAPSQLALALAALIVERARQIVQARVEPPAKPPRATAQENGRSRSPKT